ncbi:MAG: hypothetical protein AAFY71_17525 [Bacteroidota bacterium]
MKISVSKRNIKDAQNRSTKITPVELAILEVDMFEEIVLNQVDETSYSIDLDDMRIVLPSKVSHALTQYEETGEMKPLSFELAIEQELDIPTANFDMVGLEDDFSMGFDLDFI